MSKLTSKFREATAEHVMLVVLVLLSLWFFTEPVARPEFLYEAIYGEARPYPDNARVFPQMMAAVVGIGSLLLLVRNYLPGPIHAFVAESVNIAGDIEEESIEDVEEATGSEMDEEEDDEEYEKGEPLHVKWGYDINNTVIMMVFSIVYFALGYAAGLLYMTPIFVFGYMYWFRVKWYKCLLLAVLATAIIYGFVEFLLMPFDRGQIIFEGGLI